MSCQSAVSPKGARKLHDADVVYLYDGSFEGFLCCVYESFVQHELPFAVPCCGDFSAKQILYSPYPSEKIRIHFVSFFAAAATLSKWIPAAKTHPC